ncbi:MAG: hypothetical protein ABR581_06395 [Thermoleophilaceae bacterium]
MRLLILVLSASLAIAPVACGGGDKGQSYKKDFQPLNRDLAQLTRGIGRSFQTRQGESDAEIGRSFGRLADRLSKIEGDVKDLDPPKKLAAGHDSLVRAIAAVEHAMRGIEAAVRNKNVNSARQPLIDLVTSTVRMTQARQRLNRGAAAG